MSTSPILDMYRVTAEKMQSMSLSIPIKMCNMNKIVESLALINSGAGGKFIDQNYVKKIGITPQKLDEPLTT